MIIAGVPVVAAATAHRKHFDMIFVGSWISATAPFFLAFSQTVVGAVAFVVVLSVGEMAWSPRWSDYTIACAPQGKEGVFGALALAPFSWRNCRRASWGVSCCKGFARGERRLRPAGNEGSDASRFVATNGSDASDGSVAAAVIAARRAPGGVGGSAGRGDVTVVHRRVPRLAEDSAGSLRSESNRDGAAAAAAAGTPAGRGAHPPARGLTADAVADAEGVVLDASDPRAKPGGSGYVGRFAAGAETDSDSDADRREFELVPLDPEGPRRVAAYEP